MELVHHFAIWYLVYLRKRCVVMRIVAYRNFSSQKVHIDRKKKKKKTNERNLPHRRRETHPFHNSEQNFDC